MASWEFVLVYATKACAPPSSLSVIDIQQVSERRTPEWRLCWPLLGLHWHCHLLYNCCRIFGRNGVNVSRPFKNVPCILFDTLCHGGKQLPTFSVISHDLLGLTIYKGLPRVEVSTTGLVNLRLPNINKLPATQQVCCSRLCLPIPDVFELS